MERSVNMKLIVTLFWSLALGQVVGYVATALAGVPEDVYKRQIQSQKNNKEPFPNRTFFKAFFFFSFWLSGIFCF